MVFTTIKNYKNIELFIENIHELFLRFFALILSNY
jgi:hypothetical protein